MIESYEKLGVFYLGRAYDTAQQSLQPAPILYDAADLTTHAVIIGMTGSGKTGLGLSLLEEALIDRIPVIAIDPKGDLTNLLLQFPDLKPEDFTPWINPAEAAARAMTPAQFAAQQAAVWREGLARWDQSPARIAKLKAAADVAVFTPGSNAGRPVNVLRSFDPPPEVIRQDAERFAERIQTTVTGLLALLGIEADPIASREHILLANIFERTWAAGLSLDLAGMVQAVQKPPFTQLGVLDLEAVFPAKDRLALSLRINNLLAAPGFEAWMTGTPLDVPQLLFAPDGRPRASIFTISHLPDPQRMFFVTRLLNEVLAWVRTQPGTASLRAILYMDEVFGYFPPVANPPSKAPLLTLLKQARAYGLGVVLSTQNPVDLDYKGLSNIGTWFVGRLQTERDKERLLDGLEGVSGGAGLTRPELAQRIAALGKRMFLLHNVHEAAPVVFQTRWLLCYLGGPMTREQIKRLTTEQAEAAPTVPAAPAADRPRDPAGPFAGTPSVPPMSPDGLDVFFLGASGAGQGIVCQPALTAGLTLHYDSPRHALNASRTLAIAFPLQEGPAAVDWEAPQPFDPHGLQNEALPGADYTALPQPAKEASSYRQWRQDLLRWARQQQPLVLYEATALKTVSTWDESESQFRARLTQTAREQRDLAVAELRQKYAKRLAVLRDRRLRATQTVEREQAQVKSQGLQTAISFGSAVLGAFLGRKMVGVGSVGRMGTAMKSASRMGKEKEDVARAQERVEAIDEQLADLEAELQSDIDRLEALFDPATVELKETAVNPKSRDITVQFFGLAWLPFRRDSQGNLGPDWR